METPVKPIAIGADDAAYDLKAAIVDHLKSQGIAIEDYGIDDRSSKIIYPDVALLVAEAITAGKKGIRAAVCHDAYSTERSRKSNDCQIMALGGRVIAAESAKMLVDIWLASEFQGGRSTPKVARIKEIEERFK